MSSSEAEEVDNFLRVFDEMGSEEKVKTDKIATKKSIEQLMEHLGGFEYWPDLIDDCKEVVAKFLDYKTLTKLGMCSKFDNELSKKILIDVYSITIKDFENYNYQLETEYAVVNAFVLVQFDKDPDPGKSIEITFSQVQNNTKIRWNKFINLERSECMCMVIENSNYYEEAVKYAEQWMERCQFKMKEIHVRMRNYPLETSKIKFLPNCTRLHICADTVEAFRWWLDRVPEKLGFLRFVTMYERRKTYTLPSDFLSLPQIMDADELNFWARTGFTDEQLIKLKAKKIAFDAENITDDGVNEFLKKWVNGKGIEGFEQVSLYSTRSVDQERVMRGLQVRPWDDAFRKETNEFCNAYEARCWSRDNSFQISSLVEPFESLTLSFDYNRIWISATGKKATCGGRTYTSYCVPEV